MTDILKPQSVYRPLATGEYQIEEREVVQGGSVTSNVVRVRDGSTIEKTGGVDVTIFVRNDKNGPDQRDSTGGTVSTFDVRKFKYSGKPQP